MDIELTSEQQMLTESIKAFVTEELIPLEVAVEHFKPSERHGRDRGNFLVGLLKNSVEREDAAIDS